MLTAAVRKRLSREFTLDLEFTVSSGITMVLGASGAGKTTLLRSLAGLLRPDGGHIAVGGRLLFDAARAVDVPARVRNVGYVFQDLALFPHLTVEGNLRYGIAHVGPLVQRERTRAIAESFQIGHLLGRKPGEISGGERQRVALARSLVTDPALLLLDEPLSALDRVIRSRIIDDLRAWNGSRAIPILYVTHSEHEVFALGERVIVLEAGRLVAEGPPLDVLETPVRESVARLAGFENLFSARVEAVRPDAGTMRCRANDGELELEVPLSGVRAGSDVRIAIRAGDILVATDAPRGLSARNVLPGAVHSLSREGATMVARVQAGRLFQVHLTPGASESLHLAPGVRVWLVIKTHSCHVVAG